jgi:hypothetical protein
MSKDFFPPRPVLTPAIYTYEDSNPQYVGLLKVGYTAVWSTHLEVVLWRKNFSPILRNLLDTLPHFWHHSHDGRKTVREVWLNARGDCVY